MGESAARWGEIPKGDKVVWEVQLLEPSIREGATPEGLGEVSEAPAEGLVGPTKREGTLGTMWGEPAMVEAAVRTTQTFV